MNTRRQEIMVVTLWLSLIGLQSLCQQTILWSPSFPLSTQGPALASPHSLAPQDVGALGWLTCFWAASASLLSPVSLLSFSSEVLSPFVFILSILYHYYHEFSRGSRDRYEV